jgi:hypothetical protein
MSREAHVRICEGVGVRFPHATRLGSFSLPMSIMTSSGRYFVQIDEVMSGYYL